MANKVRVYGKAQNRTALGIVNAYLVMYPHATLEDLKKAFPCDKLKPAYDEMFLDEAGMQKLISDEASNNEKSFFATGQGYFQKEDEILTLAEGTKVYFISMWEKPQFERLVSYAKLYDIEIAEFERTMKGEKGGFRLEYLNGYVPPVLDSPKKKLPAWLWALIALAILGILAAVYFMGKSGQTEPATATTDTVVVHDTIYQEKIEELETKFNAAQFEQGKADLNDDAKFILHDLATLLTKNPEVRLSIEGHTSAEGDSIANQKLSEERAKATVDFLISQGVDEARLTFKGYGSSKLKNKDNPMAEENRRTEFIVEK